MSQSISKSVIYHIHCLLKPCKKIERHYCTIYKQLLNSSPPQFTSTSFYIVICLFFWLEFNIYHFYISSNYVCTHVNVCISFSVTWLFNRLYTQSDKRKKTTYTQEKKKIIIWVLASMWLSFILLLKGF